MAASKPTSLLSKRKDSFPITLNQYFGALTLGWVVSLSDTELTPAPRLLPSAMTTDWEFDKKATPFGAVLSNQYLYTTIYLQPG